MCSQTEEDPGPPLNENVMGRRDLSVALSSVYATYKMLARAFPSSRLRTSVPAVAVYASSVPPAWMVCWWSMKQDSGNAPEAIGWIAWHLQHEETGGRSAVALEDSPSLRRFIPEMLAIQTQRARKDVTEWLALYGEQPRIDIASLTRVLQFAYATR